MGTPRMRTEPLRTGDRVAVVGGGPAGSFFAIHLLREARRLGLDLEVVILERRTPLDSPDGEECRTRGCNFCVGGISPRLNALLEEHGLVLPPGIDQGSFDYVWIQGQWKNFRLRVPPGMKLNAVYRGSLPSRRDPHPTGFDAFLLGEALREGAQLRFGRVLDLDRGADGRPVLTVLDPDRAQVPLEADFAVLAMGINAGGDARLEATLRRLNPAYRPGESRRALIFELDAGEAYLARHMSREIHFLEYGSKDFALEHAALVPKGRFLTVALIGECVDKAELPRDSRALVEAFLALPQVHRILPGIERVPFTCACAPRMAVTTARAPFGDGFALIGDAVGSRLYKDGLYSAHLTASRLAQALLHEGLDRRSLQGGYGRAIRSLAADNRYGQLVFTLSRLAFARAGIGRITYQAFATEYKVRDSNRRPLTQVLWKIASGTAHYREVFWDMCRPPVLGSLLRGALVTLRNVSLEWLFGLQWGEFGRYPTVVLKEWFDVIKGQVAASLGLPLEAAPDFQAMYALKVRGSRDEIMTELARFGHAGARYLRLRIVDVRWMGGAPNEVGSVVRYHLPLVGLEARLTLTHRVGNETLMYALSEDLCTGGRLIFHLAPTKGGTRLVVYAAFNYRRGRGLLSRAFWRTARALFPEFIHDVVWNHALCTIKEEVEKRHDVPGGGGEAGPGA
jgi:flavin-dependent dehydrogenase